MSEPRREPVDFIFQSLNWNFIKELARNAKHAHDKYGSVEQYTDGPLEGEKSPLNHIQAHYTSYMAGEPHDRFPGDLRMHLVAIAYNAMMEWWYYGKRGRVPSPVNNPMEGRPWEADMPRARVTETATENFAPGKFIKVYERHT